MNANICYKLVTRTKSAEQISISKCRAAANTERAGRTGPSKPSVSLTEVEFVLASVVAGPVVLVPFSGTISRVFCGVLRPFWELSSSV